MLVGCPSLSTISPRVTTPWYFARRAGSLNSGSCWKIALGGLTPCPVLNKGTSESTGETEPAPADGAESCCPWDSNPGIAPNSGEKKHLLILPLRPSGMQGFQ